MSVCAVVGAQYGSEAKGHVVARIAQQYDHHVRVGAANAGHTVYVPTLANEVGMAHGGADTGDYDKKVMQQLPCAVYAHPAAAVYLGPGAQISAEILEREISELQAWRADRGLEPKAIFVDPRAHVVTFAQVEGEVRSGLADRIGSTSATAREGIGAAQADRVMRSEGCVTAASYYDMAVRYYMGVELVDVPMALAAADGILLEGTQGTGLSITTGDFPYCTSRNTTAAGLCADAGVAPGRLDRVIAVARTYPIRVAGNSGPFHPESREITWDSISVDPESERTTVTKKVRRVATFSMAQLAEAVAINGATEVALMFADYIDPSIAGVDCLDVHQDRLSGRSLSLARMVYDIEHRTGVPVTYLGTGPRTMIEFP